MLLPRMKLFFQRRSKMRLKPSPFQAGQYMAIHLEVQALQGL